jgi:hypothetical protein
MRKPKKRQRVTIVIDTRAGYVSKIERLVYAELARRVMGAMAGRPLRADEEVRHINGDVRDCRPENLEMWFEGRRYGKPVRWLVAEARALLADYAGIA